MSYKDIKPEQAVSDWLKIYGGDNVSAADFLCDRNARIPDKVALFYEDVRGNSSKSFAPCKTGIEARFNGAFHARLYNDRG